MSPTISLCPLGATHIPPPRCPHGCPRGCHPSPPHRTMTLGLPLLLLALALRGGAGNPPGSPPGPPCGAAALVAILGRLRELEGQVRALQGQCGDSQGPQAGTGTWGGHGEGTWGCGGT